MAIPPPALRPVVGHPAPPGSRARPGNADPSCPPAVAAKLLTSLQTGGLRYREAPTPIPGGWEAYTYRLQFEPAPNLPHSLSGPLILRIYASPQGLPRARHEFAVQSRLWGLGFPVPRPRHLEASCDVFGGPFLLMERLAGETLFHHLLKRPWHIWDAPGVPARPAPRSAYGPLPGSRRPLPPPAAGGDQRTGTAARLVPFAARPRLAFPSPPNPCTSGRHPPPRLAAAEPHPGRRRQPVRGGLDGRRGGRPPRRPGHDPVDPEMYPERRP